MPYEDCHDVPNTHCHKVPVQVKLFGILSEQSNIEQLKIANKISEGASGEVPADPKEGVHRSAIPSSPQDSPRNLRRYSLRKVPRGPREGAKEDTKEGVTSGT